MYYFVRITPANVVYALWLSLRKPVAAWKIELPDWLGRRFERVRPFRVLTRDEWLLAHDRAFDLWKAHALPSLARRHRHALKIGGRAVDFSRNLWQLLGIDFEALCLFAATLEKSHARGKPRVVEPRVAAAFERGELDAMFPGVRLHRSRANRVFEHLHEWGLAAAYLARELAWFFGGLARRTKRLGKRPVAWLGISPSEIPDRDNRLDFAWAAEHGHVPSGDVAYFLPVRLTTAQRSYLQSRGIACVEPPDSYAVLPHAARARALGGTLRGFFAAIAKPAAVAPLLARFACRAPYWDAVFSELGTTTYVTTTSYSWPEKAELSLASARGIRTIIWAYSANSLVFSVEDRRFRDLGVLRSVVVAGEYWVWNRAYAEWLHARQALAHAATEVRIVGPLMCGDASWLARDRREARAALGLPPDGLCIGVFDMAPANDAWRERFGGGPPMVDAGTYLEFWKTIEAIVLRVPDSYALVKLKRDFSHPYRALPDFLRAFVDPEGEHVRTGRVRAIDVDVDPYLPVAACDIALGVGYTSPVLAARTAGKPGYYLDPLRRANFPSHGDYLSITLTSVEEAVRAVIAACDARGDALAAAPALTPPPPHVPLSQSTFEATNAKKETTMAHPTRGQLA